MNFIKRNIRLQLGHCLMLNNEVKGVKEKKIIMSIFEMLIMMRDKNID